MAKIYLSGPMTGLPDYNYPAFHAATADLRAQGHDVYNPAEYDYRGDLDEFPVREAFADYCSYICTTATHIVVLPDWENSVDVAAEIALAKACGIPVLYVPTVISNE